MNLSELRSAGGIVSAEPIKKTVKWAERQFEVYVIRQSFGTVEKLVMGLEGRSKNAALIASFIRLGDGSEELDYADAYQLAPDLATEFIRVINEVYQGDGEKKA